MKTEMQIVETILAVDTILDKILEKAPDVLPLVLEARNRLQGLQPDKKADSSDWGELVG